MIAFRGLYLWLLNKSGSHFFVIDNLALQYILFQDGVEGEKGWIFKFYKYWIPRTTYCNIPYWVPMVEELFIWQLFDYMSLQ